jgi:UDP-3-O-[3-hydroxymyristoyl] glucosamine N-acyltransferase
MDLVRRPERFGQNTSDRNVIIGNNVAPTLVDRGKFSSTVLGDGCKIDNLVQMVTTVLGRFALWQDTAD